ncbi:helix-turn-helix domain-containing protein [Pseudoalteromonas sp. NZS71]|uniref:helix-turn-helix domain-containing protein n=1 Tax=unclassified Pseudoalteromonas TaxID=194690 RepID=UPI000465336E|nr:MULTISPECIES: helix-turn-helix domain-containing protein [unclassified Pseudoalteromonas]MBH0063486.1 helix-turn-helix domain-containing protein [Pseudoalteromonas sp. NZS71]
MTHSKTKTSLYRRAYVTWLISTGVNTVPAIIEATGMPRRTAQDTLAAIPELSIALENKGGSYSVVDWGMLNKAWLKNNLQHVKDVLLYP